MLVERSRLAHDLGKLGLGPVGEATAHLFGARELLEHAVVWIERNFPSGDATDPS